MYSLFIHNGQLLKLNSSTGDTWVLGPTSWIPVITEYVAEKDSSK